MRKYSERRNTSGDNTKSLAKLKALQGFLVYMLLDKLEFIDLTPY